MLHKGASGSKRECLLILMQVLVGLCKKIWNRSLETLVLRRLD